MKRLFAATLTLLLCLGMAPVDSTSAQATDQFRITQYDIHYALSRDSEGRSVLRTTENITAVFPQTDLNRGLERSIPHEYNGHSTSLKIVEATDSNNTHQFSKSKRGDATVLRIGNPDEYVHGEQSYTIVYEQRDVTRFYKDTGRDEWYWDTNGTDWRVPIDLLTVSVDIDESIESALVGTPSCYFGGAGSRDACQFAQTPTAGDFSLVQNNLQRNENVTVALGFNKGTFKERPWHADIEFNWATFQILAIPFALALVIISTIVYGRVRNRTSETHTLVAEYIPPKDTSITVASRVVGQLKGSVFAAQLIDLAVRRFIKIVQTKEKSFWLPARYDIVIAKNPSTLLPEEKEIIEDMFGHLPKENERLALTKLQNSTSYSKRTMDNDKKLNALIYNNYGIREKSPKKAKRFYIFAALLGVISVVLISIPLMVAAGFVWILGLTLRPLTDKGLALRRYVFGLDKYIKASEAERLAFLQGPETAEKVGYDVDPSNPGQVLKLYERVLPYAILFGREKEWAKRLGEFYGQANTSPDWYSGNGAFNAAVFATVLTDFSQASSYSSGSSSSSGGSSGGGSSGGGGGGGGGGGW